LVVEYLPNHPPNLLKFRSPCKKIQFILQKTRKKSRNNDNGWLGFELYCFKDFSISMHQSSTGIVLKRLVILVGTFG
jgi:hypothetical protein